MRKTLSILIAATMIIALSACMAPAQNNTTAKTSANDTAAPSTVSPVQSNEQFKPLEIKGFGYSTQSGYLYYGIIIHNPNDNIAVKYPSFRMTARDKNGGVVGTGKQVLSIIYPQQDFIYGFQGFEVTEEPARVDAEVLEPDPDDAVSVGLLDHPDFKPLQVAGANKRNNRVLGEVANQNDYSIDKAVVSVIFKDTSGKIISGNSAFVDKIPAGGKAPFDLLLPNTSVSENYEVYANLW